MRLRKNSNILMLLVAILAFVPVLAADFIVDNFVRVRESIQLQRAISSIAAETQAGVYDAIEVTGDLLASSPSFCTPTFAENLRNLMMRSQHLRQMVVENANGVQYCEALGGKFEYARLSETLSIPGRPETITAVSLEGLDVPLLKVTRTIDANRSVSAFVNISNSLAAGHRPVEFAHAEMLRLSFVDGTDLLVRGDATPEQVAAQPGNYMFVTALAGDVPVRAAAAVRFSALRAEYSDLYVLFTFVASLMSAAFLILALQYVRKTGGASLNLERAIVNGEIQPWYQPVIDLETGRLVGCEMLARWIKPNGEVISPGVFIDYAEVTGLAIPMTISLMQRMRDDLSPIAKVHGDLKFSLNLFEGHFRSSTIVEDVEAVFGGSSIAYKQLVFEITERHPLNNDVTAQTVINGLHALGSKLALDDVGTGHSNLAYIQTLGVDVLKIDGIFVQMIKEDTTKAPVLDALINMAKHMNAEIVAEGVETIEQAKYLREQGVRQVQGYLFAKPLPFEKFSEMVFALNGQAPVPTKSNLPEDVAA